MQLVFMIISGGLHQQSSQGIVPLWKWIMHLYVMVNVSHAVLQQEWRILFWNTFQA